MIAGRTALVLALGAAMATPAVAQAGKATKNFVGFAGTHSEKGARVPQSLSRHRIATAHGSGEFPIVTLAGIVSSPSRALISVTATPSQEVIVSWAAVCPGSATKHGQFAAEAPFRRSLGITGKVSGSCSVGLRVAPEVAGAVAVTLED